jgi:hypothetical protein
VKRLLLVAAVLSGCFGFERRVAACFDGGVCVGDAGAPGGGAADGGRVGDGGRADSLDAGFFCSGAWCWENPFPHGTRLTAAFLSGEDLIVAGEDGLLQERRAGVWRSLHTLVPGIGWLNLWGRSMDDVWLSGASRVWHRTATGWQPVGTDIPAGYTEALVGTPTSVFMSVGDTVYEWNPAASDWAAVRTFQSDGPRVVALATAFDGGVFAMVLRSTSSELAMIPSGLTATFSSGSSGALFGTSTALFTAGTPSRRLDAALNVTVIDPVQAVAETSNGLVLAATATDLGVLTDAGRFVATASGRDVRAIATSDSRAVAVGDDGLLLEFDGTRWRDAGVRETSNVVSFVELDGQLHAVTASCDVLRRTSDRWLRVGGPRNTGCVDAVARGEFLELLTTEGGVLTLDAVASFALVAQVGALAPAPRRLWVTPGNALVATTGSGVFVRSAPGNDFTQVTTQPAWGIGGRGEVVRLCDPTNTTVTELNLAAQPVTPQPVANVSVSDCRAVLALSDGRWAYGSRGGASALHVVIDGTPGANVKVNELTGTLDALVELDGGVALCAAGVAIVSTSRPVSPLALEPLPHSRQLITGTVWRGRFFVGGWGGALLERAAP